MLVKTEEIENLFSDMNQGLIYIDNQCKIKMFNDKAKEIVGVKLRYSEGHESGVLEKGDIIIIADNSLGGDDGGLKSSELSKLNIHDSDILEGDTLLAVGVFENNRINPVYKYTRGNQIKDVFKLETNYFGNSIKACIDEVSKIIEISFNEKTFKMKFFQEVGHMVVIDGKKGKVKFFQDKGYSIRKEEIGLLLRGNSFQSKGPKGLSVKVLDVDFREIFEKSDIVIKVCEYFKGVSSIPENGLYNLNKRLLYCSFYHGSGDGLKSGLYIVIKDAGELEEYLKDRNYILEQVEKSHKFGDLAQKGFPIHSFNLFVGNSPETNEVKYLAYKASQTQFNVILTGESGTGKSLLAREIHNNSPRSEYKFVEVNCNAIAPTLFESELFGYVGGAFTGAASSGNTGYFEEADGGTIFLDEIGDIPLEIQVKLLHVLQNKVIYRVGSSKPIKINVRVIAATNKNLEEEVLRGSFRQDLYYRINVFPIEIPPIRERKSDLYVMINEILRRICFKYEMEDKQLSGESLNKILRYDWPGNVRELENILERAITLCSTRVIFPEHIRINETDRKYCLKEMLAREEKRLILEYLTMNDGDKEKTILDLGVSRTSFYEKLKKYDLT